MYIDRACGVLFQMVSRRFGYCSISMVLNVAMPGIAFTMVDLCMELGWYDIASKVMMVCETNTYWK